MPVEGHVLERSVGVVIYLQGDGQESSQRGEMSSSRQVDYTLTSGCASYSKHVLLLSRT